MPAASLSAQDLLDQGVTPELPGERLRNAILSRLNDLRDEGRSREEALQALYPNTLLDVDVLERITGALVSGGNVLLLGPPGSGKTNLAKDVWNLFPKESVVVDGCPVQDDPFSLIDEAFSRQVPPCPHCQLTYGGDSVEEHGGYRADAVDAADVPVRTTRLREGYGLSRIQGSPEVFPDYLTGAVNLAKLEEVGDPESPLVLEPGKIMQANRGVLLIDEVGKLPRGTQNVLLQALQENIVTPSKSRETFPASFVAITTSNTDDMDMINEPLTGRLTSVLVDFNEDTEKNRGIVSRALATSPNAGYVPGPLREAAVRLTELWRKTTAGAPDLAEVGSNRTMIDVVRRTESAALLRGETVATPEDFRAGARDAMVGRVRGRSADGYRENCDAVNAFLGKQVDEVLGQSAENYWCGFFRGVLDEDKAEAARVVNETREVLRDAKKLQTAFDGKGFTKFRKWADYVETREGEFDAQERADRHRGVFHTLEDLKTFQE